MLMPSTLSLLRTIFTDRDQRRLAIAIWAAAFSAGAALGPIVGGLLLEHFAWGSVFLMAVPVLRAAADPRAAARAGEPRPAPRAHRPDQHPAVARGHGADRLRDQGVRRRTASAPHRRSLFAVGIGFGVAVRASPAAARDARCSTWRCSAADRSRGAILVNLLSVIALVGFLLLRGAAPAADRRPDSAAGRARAGAGPRRDDRRRARSWCRSRSAFSPRVIVPAALAFSVAGYVIDRRSRRRDDAAHHDRARLRGARRRHRHGRDGVERADPLERSAREGRCGERRVRDRVRTRRGARHDDPRRHSSRRCTAAVWCCPAGLPAGAADASRETLAGAVAASEEPRSRTRAVAAGCRRHGVRRGRRCDRRSSVRGSSSWPPSSRPLPCENVRVRVRALSREPFGRGSRGVPCRVS